MKNNSLGEICTFNAAKKDNLWIRWVHEVYIKLQFGGIMFPLNTGKLFVQQRSG